MSETDDTDDLLLIPPDFFLVTSEPDPPYYNIVNSLIRQVGNLRNRIATIESTSDISLVGSYLDQTLDCPEGHSMFQPRKYNSSEEIHSTNSTPQKPRSKFKLSSLPASPNIGKFSPNVKYDAEQRNSNDTGILNEVDSFISNVKTIQRNHAVRNLQNDFDSVNSNEKDVKDILKEFQEQSQKIASENRAMESKFTKESTWRCGDDVNTVPDYNLGARYTLYKENAERLKLLEDKSKKGESHKLQTNPTAVNSESELPVQSVKKTSESTEVNLHKQHKYENISNKPRYEKTVSTQKSIYHTVESKEPYRLEHVYKPLSTAELKSYTSLDRFDSDSSSDSTQMTVFNKLPKNREDLVRSPLHINALNALNMHRKTMNTAKQIKDNKISKKRGGNMISENLGLLNLADIWGAGQQSPSKMVQKLEEERIKRQHCEQLIQDLQNKNLELQQKLAVAVNVDESKNKTIDQFREALEKTSHTVEKLSIEKSTWDQETENLKQQFLAELEAATQRANYYEKEMSKALNLAHGNQDKIVSLEKKCLDLQKELELIEDNFKHLVENYEKEVGKNKQMTEIITQKELEISKNKAVLIESKAEIASSNKAVENCQKEFSALKEECSRLQNDLKQEHALTTSLTENKKKLDHEIQIFKNRENSLSELLSETKNKLESTKIELRNFYQGQLELIVESKRKEMQTQLDHERQKYEEEFKKKELHMAKTAATHIKEITDKCALEIKLLEEKHQEETRLYQLQVKRSQKEVDSLQHKLAQLPEKRAQIAKELQKVMECQWSEAIRIIGDTPTSFTQSQGLPNKPQPLPLSRQNTYTKIDQMVLRQDFPPTINPRRETKEDETSEYDETPVSSRGGAARNSESEIQKYINMLLIKAPGNPTGAPHQNFLDFPTSEQSQWHPGNQENLNSSQTLEKSYFKHKRTDKPPWK